MDRAFSVQVQDLTKTFGKFVAVDHINFQVYDGEIFGFLGANGAGKTTTIKMLCGLLLPTSGSGFVEGLDIFKQTEEIKRIIGYMSQKFSLYEDLTVEENLRFYGGIYGMGEKELRQACERTSTCMGLGDHLKKMTRSIPLGWKQRLALSCAILHNPKILFLDEPTGGVDPISRRDFWDVIHQLASEGTTVFVTTHYMDEAEYCNRLSIMHDGRIIAMGSPTELKQTYAEPTIEDVFIKLIQKNKM
jgi:ABC-2 type transport system ATP-binding protein